MILYPYITPKCHPRDLSPRTERPCWRMQVVDGQICQVERFRAKGSGFKNLGFRSSKGLGIWGLGFRV